jgi:hypothetical protein
MTIFSKDFTRGQAVQAVSPNHARQMGGTGAVLTVGSGAVANSDPAPIDGIVIVTIPAGSTGAIRIGETVVATANDQQYPGGQVYHFPIQAGWRVSIFGDASGFDATISMAL